MKSFLKELSQNAPPQLSTVVSECETEKDDHESEESLVLRVQEGDLSAFEHLLEIHSAHLRAFVAMKLPVPHLIDEIAHETFVFSHRHIMDFKAGTDFGKWLRAIAFNLVRKETLRHQRLSKNREKFLQHYLIEESLRSEPVYEAPLIAVLEECLSRLPEQQRRLLERRYTLVESSREIGTAFGRSESWVRTTLCRVRSTLRQCIEQKVNAAKGLI